MNDRVRCQPAGAAHAQALLELFESTGNGCFCNYWHFEGDKNAWLERCYVKPELNRQALVERLAAAELCGVVALDEGGRALGWLKLTRAPSLPRLYTQRVYRNLPCFEANGDDDDRGRENVYAVGCCYIAETERGRGLAHALLQTAIASAREAGGTALEAFPRGAPEHAAPLRADEIWMGPEALFLKAGFAQVSDFRPYPVLRLSLSDATQ